MAEKARTTGKVPRLFKEIQMLTDTRAGGVRRTDREWDAALHNRREVRNRVRDSPNPDPLFGTFQDRADLLEADRLTSEAAQAHGNMTWRRRHLGAAVANQVTMVLDYGDIVREINRPIEERYQTGMVWDDWIDKDVSERDAEDRRLHGSG